MTGIDEKDALARYPGAVSFRYGDSAALNAEVLGLVLEGRKTVTCDAWAAFEARGEAPPRPGRTDIALNWDGRAMAAVRTLKVETYAFDEMPERLVPPQGEFRDLADWRAGYEAYLGRAGHFTPQVAMMVETFEVVERF
ncbi:MAG: ASCH domain-containing protein [Sulfitobacter sp.]|nr:ASCH domain-containing protein [Sulfitobacter sp.]